MEIYVTLHFETSHTVTTTYPESKFLEATTEYLRYMQKLQPGQKVTMTSVKFKSLY